MLRRTSAFRNSGWRFFVNLSSDSTALVIEGGEGACFAGLANELPRVSTLIPANLPGRWPFPDASFDLVVMRGIGDDFALPAHFSSLLPQIHRVLRPEGSLYVGGRGIFPLLQAIRLLFSGFGFPEVFFHGEDQRKITYEIRPCFKSAEPLEWLKTFFFAFRPDRHFSLLAKKNGTKKAKSLMDNIINELTEPRDHGADHNSHSLQLGSFNIYGIHTSGHVVRIPTTDDGKKHCDSNERALKDLEGKTCAFQIPRFMQKGIVNGQEYYAESKIPGRPLNYLELSSADRQTIYGQIQRHLAQLYRQTSHSFSIDVILFERLFSGPITTLANQVTPAARQALLKMEKLFENRFLGRSIKLVRTHGDFKATNFLLGKNRSVSGIVDWDLSDPAGLPLMDMILCFGFDRSVDRRIDIYRAIYEIGFEHPSEFEGKLNAELKTYADSGVGFTVTVFMTFIGYCLNHPSPELMINREWLEGVSACVVKASSKFESWEGGSHERK